MGHSVTEFVRLPLHPECAGMQYLLSCLFWLSFPVCFCYGCSQGGRIGFVCWAGSTAGWGWRQDCVWAIACL
jgi:hypothetical protein